MGLPRPRFLARRERARRAGHRPEHRPRPGAPVPVSARARAPSANASAACPALLFPYGPDGTRAFYEGLAAAFGKTVSYAEREREAWAACEREVAALRGRLDRLLLRRAARTAARPHACARPARSCRSSRTPRSTGNSTPPRSARLDGRRNSRSARPLRCLRAPVAARARSRRRQPQHRELARGHGLRGEVVDGTDVPADPRFLRRADALSACSRRPAPPRCAGRDARRRRRRRSSRSTSTSSAPAPARRGAAHEARRLGVPVAGPRRREQGGRRRSPASTRSCARPRATATARSCSRCSSGSACSPPLTISRGVRSDVGRRSGRHRPRDPRRRPAPRTRDDRRHAQRDRLGAARTARR